MFAIEITDEWRQCFPGGHVGILAVSGVDNRRRKTPLDNRKRAIETELRASFAGYSRAQLREIDILKAYRNYYKKFNKTYHVQLQLESIVLKERHLPSVTPLVDANFAAELETLVLTSGHDIDLLEGAVRIGVTSGGERFLQMSGQERTLKANDMMMADEGGVACTIIYGQDNRSPISPKTTRAVYVAYGPAGVPPKAIGQQLAGIRDYIFMFAPDTAIDRLSIHAASGGA